jgi:hypothetical protein
MICSAVWRFLPIDLLLTRSEAKSEDTCRTDLRGAGQCSGSLIADRYNSLVDKPVFLTAGHCARGVLNYLAQNNLPRSSFWVSFDRYATEDEDTSSDPDGHFNYPRIQVGEGESDIQYYLACYTTGPCGVNEADFDIAVLVLEPETLQGGALPEPAKLATLNLLDDLWAQRALRGQRLTAVGYGITDYTPGSGAYEWEAERYAAQETYLALGPGYLIASMNANTGNGGSCFGDSGGPILLPDPDNDPDVPDTIVSIVSMGDAVCRALDQSYRVDTPFPHEFLRRFVDAD